MRKVTTTAAGTEQTMVMPAKMFILLIVVINYDTIIRRNIMEEFTIYAEWDFNDYSECNEVGEIQLDPDEMPDRFEVNGFTYEVKL